MSKEFEDKVLLKLETLDKLEENNKHFEEFEKNVLLKLEVLDRLEKDNKHFKKFEEKAWTKFDSIDKRFESIEETLQVMKDSILIIEDKVCNEIPALFDGYSMHEEKQKQQSEEINSLNNIAQSNSIRISILEDKAEEHSKKLKTLIS